MIRMEKIVSKIKEEKVIDIGSDHAYLLIKAIKSEIISKGLAIEITKGPLENARLNINKNGLSEKIETIQSDGLLGVDREVVHSYDAICICGMGGVLINKILNDAKDKLANHTLYLQANNNIDKLRRNLMLLGYQIIDEELVKESDIIYEIIVAKKTNTKILYDEKQLMFGPILLQNKNQLFIEKYENQLQYLKVLLDRLNEEKISSEKIKKEYNLIKEQLCN